MYVVLSKDVLSRAVSKFGRVFQPFHCLYFVVACRPVVRVDIERGSLVAASCQALLTLQFGVRHGRNTSNEHVRVITNACRWGRLSLVWDVNTGGDTERASQCDEEWFHRACGEQNQLLREVGLIERGALEAINESAEEERRKAKG